MKIIIIRHADPDYTIDSLTEKGWHEAEFLSQRLEKMKLDKCYVSPLGRARDTADVTLKKIQKEAEVLPWLREFHAPVIDDITGQERIPWDMLPEKWTSFEEYYQKDLWMQTELMQSGPVSTQAEVVYEGLDTVLKNHGYNRNGNWYKVEKGNNDTLVFFCHFGVECVMLGHLLGISPVILWHGFCAAPSSVTTLVTEERRKGIAYFRMSAFGDISHLIANNEEPAFAARFCENFENEKERHD